ncbi:hypothetical protein DACRYDRAFT_96415 [Dacryopinax primogenitus]|uniref:Uncharacterized protein n=1 Tax=Dacryopinax primogenitus (strain DJM 731) TaxID=1858805 RepID=M5FYM6_DACPD|nr:uncharacterized protein DACRYDRAFT_96415 [Dacryopinax primogenitus]EJT98646.1 hypothetical protein DACRYDRAFT_96415 [Dacryopinax primogenitus]
MSTEFTTTAVPQSGVNARKEDAEAAQSEQSRRIPQSEVDDLGGQGNVVEGYTRGKKVDAFRQEREVDEAVERAMEQDEGMN